MMEKLAHTVGTPFSVDRSFGYDTANRLGSFTEPSKSQSFGYDAFGNLWQTAASGVPALRPNGSSWYLLGSGQVSNRLANTACDAAGHQTQLSLTPGTTASYDAEGRVSRVELNSSPVATYDYDADGRRVKKTVGATTTYYVYSADGQLMAEYGGTPATVGTRYLVADHLGSTRLILDAQGNCAERIDYAPFGAQLTRSGQPCYTSSTSGLPLFTGQIRDAESAAGTDTGLDYFGARYFSAAQGGFTSPDPLLNSGRPWLPQSWNRYAYALNNPLKYTDPTGLYEWAANCASGDTQCEQNRQMFRDALSTVRTAAEQLKEGSKERKKLDGILGKYGDEGEKNKVKIAFGAAGGYPAEQSTSFFSRTNTITFDTNMIGSMLSRNAQVNSDYKLSIGFAEIVTHEGSHMLDKFFFGNPVNREGSYRTEFNAFESQSYVPMSLNQYSHYGFWNPSWAAADRETRREKAVQKAAEDHVTQMWGPLKKP